MNDKARLLIHNILGSVWPEHHIEVGSTYCIIYIPICEKDSVNRAIKITNSLPPLSDHYGDALIYFHPKEIFR